MPGKVIAAGTLWAGHQLLVISAMLIQSLLLQCGDEGSVYNRGVQTSRQKPACLGHTEAGL